MAIQQRWTRTIRIEEIDDSITYICEIISLNISENSKEKSSLSSSVSTKPAFKPQG